jgi:hypothetical protein
MAATLRTEERLQISVRTTSSWLAMERVEMDDVEFIGEYYHPLVIHQIAKIGLPS